MSSEYYFRKWKQTLVDLEALVHLDVQFQETQVHDKRLCEATRRISGILSRYMMIYNDVWECLHQDLQVQKTSYVLAVLKAVVARILELKHELQKLENSEYHFGCNGLIDHLLIPDNTQLTAVPEVNERPEGLGNLLKDVFVRVKERKKLTEEEEAAKANAPEEEAVDNWWDVDAEIPKDETYNNDDEKKIELTPEQVECKRMVEIIQAQEKSRQVIQEKTQKQNKRTRWAKELAGTLAPPARYEVREKAAELIQQVCREFFKQKRLKILQCKRNELLGINPCLKAKTIQKEILEQTHKRRAQLKRKYLEQWKTEYQNKKEEYIKKHSPELQEDYRGFIREWYRVWYESIKFFNDIPPTKHGGATLIIKDELPTPEEWLEQYEVYLAEQKANKNKSAMDRKFAKDEAKREAMELKRAEHLKKKHEEELRRKIMKNPNMHPGFDFPKSRKTENILETISHYYKDWAELDAKETLDVKEKNVVYVDMANVYMESKLEIVATVEDDMRNELKLLKKALKIDYEVAEEVMPEPMKQTYRKEKKKKRVNKTMSVNLAEKLEDLVFHEFVREYPKTKIEEFIGDLNFGGDELRCNFEPSSPNNGEMRTLWWDKCRQMSNGLNKILLVGPRASGKTKLVHILATMNDAVLFELDPRLIHVYLENGANLDHLVHSVATCARALQPAVLHVKHVHRLFYRKVPSQDAGVDWNLIQRYLTKKLFKFINKTDKVTLIGTCVEPWTTKSNQILKQFPTVVLMPATSHGTVAMIIKNWMLSHTVIPTDFDVSCLAHVLKVYSFGYLEGALERFLTAERKARIAARGLSPMDIYDFILSDNTAHDTEYNKYLKWYISKTAWGRREQKHIEDQLLFKQALANYEEKMAKRKKTKPQ